MFDQGTAIGTDESNQTSIPAWQRLHGEMKSATRRRSAWDAEHARHLREAEAMQLWVHFGYISILEYLEREHGIEPRTAHDRLRVSHALAELPLLEAELEDGTFQYSHVKELTRVVTPETEEDWITAARGKTCGEVQAMVAGHKQGDGPEDPSDPDLRLRDLSLKLRPQTLAFYREQYAAIEAELGHRVDEADMFQIMMERVRDCREGLSTPAQISISHCKRGWQDGGGFRAELDPAQIACELCDAEHLGSVDGEPGRKAPTLSRRTRQRILARHRHRCAVPGCRSAKNIDIHHLIHQEDGGGHEDWNLVALCSGHHMTHHRGDLAIEGRAPDAIRFEWRNRPRENAHVGTNGRHQPAATSEAVRSRFGDAAMRAQARDALAGLGWKPGIARAAVDDAIAHAGTDVRIEQLIREALRRCPKPLG